MSTTIQCPSCAAKLALPESSAGKRVKCPKCATVLTVPAAKSVQAKPAKPVSKGPVPGAKRSIRCPGCQKSLSVPASAAGKTVQCPQCSTKLKIPGSPPSAGPAKKAAPRPAPRPKQAAPSDDLFGGSGSGGSSDPFGDLGNFASPPASGGGFGGGAPASASPPSFGGGAASAYAPPAGGGNSFGASGGGGGGGNDRNAFYIINGAMIALWAFFYTGYGCLNLAMLIVLMVTGKYSDGTLPFIIGQTVGYGVIVMLGLTMFSGGITMAMRKKLNASRAAAIIAAIPCFGCIAFPFGIWATVLLFSANAKKDFRS
ncbi:Mu-like prophage protein Com [Roseimaritima multifibrata]|uniref:Mu-like prophage protein Com n=1 Tax=Roseimaritima multifibrata TaxID=1930274 RepID=A0A517MCM5_9BACT|nr:hypothetical protein [Roseimaritima multifibrata]QDS92576.1 Mu-like prophage protein Com [Roseimaritima multifibrata]